MLDSTPSQELSPFAKTVEAALEDFGDAAKLGSESPLAAPYLLYQQLEPHELSAEARGKKLRMLLRKAVDAIEGKYQTRYQTILREYYFQGQSEQYICQLIEKGRGIFYKSRKAAIEQVAAIVSEQLQPALQREAPPRMSGVLTGRRNELHICQQALNAGKTIAITGNSGVGKTTLATHLAAQWQKDHLFWYTMRPGFNDQISSILFALGYFFKTLGEPILWQQALAQSTTVTPERMTEIVRHLLQQLHQQKIIPLFCFDEIDLLQPAQQAEHGQIIAFLESLRHEMPMMLIGQQSTLTVDLFCPLHELTLSEVSQMLENAQIRLKPDQIQLIHTYTTGNPRLLDELI